MLLLSACGSQEVYNGLAETEANEMIAVLSGAGIKAEKAAGDKEQWSVSVSSGDFSRAVEVLRANGLPRDEFDSLGTVFKKENFGSSPLSERARLNYALSQELSHTISQIDGVVQARVHLALPEGDALTKEAAPSSASVFVKYRQGFDLRSQSGAIKTLVTNSIEGLNYDRVSVIMTPARTVVTPAKTDVASIITSSIMAILGVILAAALALFGWRWWRSSRANQGRAVVATGRDGDMP